MDMPAAVKALQLAQPIPSFLKELNSSGKKMSCSQKDPLKLKTKIFNLLLETKLHCKDNQTPFPQPHRQLIADAAHPKGTTGKSSSLSVQGDSLILCPLGKVLMPFSLVHLKTSGEDTLPLNPH